MTPRARQQVWLWAALVVALLGLGAASLWRGLDNRLIGRSRNKAAAVAATGALGDLADYGRVPDFHLVSQTGDSVRLADLHGAIWIGDFIFTSCETSCPMMSAQMRSLGGLLDPAAHVRLVSFSVDPERDTPARLADYARAYNAVPERWLFLTGDKQQIRHLAVEGFHLSVADPTPQEKQAGADAVMHSTRLALVDGDGAIRGYYDGTDPKAVGQLEKDARRLVSSGGAHP